MAVIPSQPRSGFDIACRRCPRLSAFLDQVSIDYPAYHARPVAPFGALDCTLLIVGLAPGMHGANASGRPFTGDYAGILLYETLYKFGFSNQPLSTALNDGLQLHNCRITNAVKCLPPDNKPESKEVNQCNAFLEYELTEQCSSAVILALGTIAHKAVIKALAAKQSAYPFGHGAVHQVGDRILVDSYHCSRYNINTRRLNAQMFESVFSKIKQLLEA